MKYFYDNDIFVEVKLNSNRGKNFIGIYFSPGLLNKIREIEQRFMSQYAPSEKNVILPFSFVNTERARFHSEILAAINEIFCDDMETYYIPAQRKMLEDAQTKLFIKTKGEIYIVAVDNGIVGSIAPKIRKCDFLIYDEAHSISYLVELKGAIIDEAFKQLQASLANITSIPQCKFLVNNINMVFAYIVSPHRMSIPSGIEEKERILARALASKCKIKVTNILNLVKYITIVPKTHSVSENNRRIVCSNAHPLEL